MNGEKRESAGNGHQEMIPGSETGRKAAGAREKWRRLAEAFSGRSTPELRRKSPVVDLSEMMRTLAGITDEQWGRYAFSRDPLDGKFDLQQKLSLEPVMVCTRALGHRAHTLPLAGRESC